MANRENTASNKKGRKSSKRKKKPPTFTGNQRAREDTQTRNEKERTVKTLPKIGGGGGGGIEKMPSNSPTMAIAPSDYEHIFHEGAGQAEKTNATIATNVSPQTKGSPTAAALPQYSVSPPPQTSDQYDTMPTGTRTRLPEPEIQYPQYSARPQFAPPTEVQATPDGYTLLGHSPDTTSSNRVALPPYIVRASNQFSRAALARVAMYLATRADPADRYR